MGDAPNSVRTERLTLCPYCGHTQRGGDRCETCRGLFEPLSRKATQIAMGPWYLRDTANPFRPGFSYETLQQQIASGRIKPVSVLRGPTTRQFWTIARHVPGVAHLLGYCHACDAHVKPTDTACPECAASFKFTPQRNELGLSYPNEDAARRAQGELEVERAGGIPLQTTPPLPGMPAGPTAVKAPAATNGRSGSRAAQGRPVTQQVVVPPSAKPRPKPAPGRSVAGMHAQGSAAKAPARTPRPEPAMTSTAVDLGTQALWVLVGITVAAIITVFIWMMYLRFTG